MSETHAPDGKTWKQVALEEAAKRGQLQKRLYDVREAVELRDFDAAHQLTFIEQYEYPIEIAPRDGTSFQALDPAFGWVECHWYVHPSVQGWVSDEIDCNEHEFSPRSWRPSTV